MVQFNVNYILQIYENSQINFNSFWLSFIEIANQLQTKPFDFASFTLAFLYKLVLWEIREVVE